MKKSRMLCFLIVLAMILPAYTAVTPVYGATFYDTAGHWAESYISQAVNNGIIQGYPNGTFKPDSPVSRAEFTSMINKLLKNTSSTSTAFYDVPYGSWYYQDVAKGVAAAYITGYSNNSFSPDAPITRQEAAVILSRIVPAYGSSGSLYSYGDSYLIPDWAFDAFQQVNTRGYMGAYPDGKLHPNDQLTRAQATKILCDIQGGERIVTANTVVRNTSTLSNTIYSNGVSISSDLRSGNVMIENCVILGTLEINSGSNSDVTLSNSRVANVRTGGNFYSSNLIKLGNTTVVNQSGTGLGYNNYDYDDNYYDGSVTFSPKDGARNVSLTAKITITFDSAMRLYGGDTIYRDDIEDIIYLGEDSSHRYDVPFSANINSARRVITITPDSRLERDMTYYLTIPRNSFEDSRGNGNRAYTIAFSTGSRLTNDYYDYDDDYYDNNDDIVFYPRSRATGVSSRVEPSISFPRAIVTYNGGNITASYLRDAIVFREDSSSGRKVPFTASINSSRNEITITPDDTLASGQEYYLGISSKQFRYRSGNETISSRYIYFTVGRSNNTDTTPQTPAPVISSPTQNPPVGASQITINVSGSSFRSPGTVSDWVITNTAGTAKSIHSVIPAASGANATLILTQGLAAGDRFTIQARASAFSPASSASNTLTFNVPAAGSDPPYSGTQAQVPTEQDILRTSTQVVLNPAYIAGQTVEYAVSTTTTAPSASSAWQTGTTFSGLSPSTTYYFFARVQALAGEHQAGGASAPLVVKTY